MIRTTQLKGKQLKERLQKLSQPINEGVVSMVEPTKYHNRISPTSKILQTFHNQNGEPSTSTRNPIEDEEDEDWNVEDFLSELEDEIMMDDILDELGYQVEVDSVEEINFNSKGYKEGKRLVSNLRSGLFRKLDDEELDDFMDVLSNSFDMVRR